MKKINRKYYDPDSKAYDPCCKYGNMTLTVKNMAMTVKNMTLTVKYMNLNLTVKNMTITVKNMTLSVGKSMSGTVKVWAIWTILSDPIPRSQGHGILYTVDIHQQDCTRGGST